MKIRQFRDEDASAVVRVVHDALEESNVFDYPQRIIDRMIAYFTEQFFVEKAREDLLLVAVEDGEVLGTARLDGDVITNMFVAPYEQGRGIGTRLTHALEDAAREKGLEQVRLYGSLTAVKFYEKLGYEQVDVALHETFGTNAVMKKRL